MSHPFNPPAAQAAAHCSVSVIIKALNEEDNVAAAAESALSAVSAYGGEVILADSCSTDRTVAAAARFPIRIAAAPVLLMAIRKRSLTRAVYSVVSWCVNTAGLVRGVLRPRKAAWEPIRSVVLKEPSAPLRTPSRSVT